MISPNAFFFLTCNLNSYYYQLRQSNLELTTVEMENTCSPSGIVLSYYLKAYLKFSVQISLDQSR